MTRGLIRRRELLGTGAAAAGALAFGPAFWRTALAAGATRVAESPYGPLGAPDANGLMLPAGFKSRVVARAGQVVPGSAYPWHIFPDGQATFSSGNGGYILVSNSEAPSASGGGSSSISFAADGKIVGAQRILSATNLNCAGGPTPWGTWLSCEEFDGGHVWECDPTGVKVAQIRPALGTFSHEAVTVDPVGRRLYLTEDKPDGCFYRFTPDTYEDLSAGLLEVAVADAQANVTWKEVPDPAAVAGTTRSQVQGAAKFSGGEGIWFDSGFVYFSTKGDNRIRAYDTAKSSIEVVYDRTALGDGAPLSGLDNLTVSRAGDLYVCEDGGDMEIGLLTPQREVSRFLKLTGEAAENSEMAGVIFDPSGTRMYFSSQRGFGTGATFEVTGPFRATAPGPRPVATPPKPAPRTPASRPKIRLRVPRSVTVATLRARGLTVAVTADKPVRISAVLRTSELAKPEPGRRGSAPKPRVTRLAVASRRTTRKGTAQLRLKTGARVSTRLRSRRATRAEVAVVVVDRAGNRQIATAAVRIRPRG